MRFVIGFGLGVGGANIITITFSYSLLGSQKTIAQPLSISFTHTIIMQRPWTVVVVAVVEMVQVS